MNDGGGFGEPLQDRIPRAAARGLVRTGGDFIDHESAIPADAELSPNTLDACHRISPSYTSANIQSAPDTPEW